MLFLVQRPVRRDPGWETEGEDGAGKDSSGSSTVAGWMPGTRASRGGLGVCWYESE